MGEEIKIGGEQRWARGHRCRGDTIVMGEGDRGRGGAERCWPEARETACQWEEEKVPPKHSATLALVPHAPSLVRLTCKYRLWGGRMLNSNISTRRKTGSPPNLNTFLT